jgi:hypothetical protein
VESQDYKALLEREVSQERQDLLDPKAQWVRVVKTGREESKEHVVNLEHQGLQDPEENQVFHISSNT